MVASAELLSIRIAEVQLLLSEKRTSLAVLRSGMGIFLLPLSLFTALIATSKFYSGADAAPIVLPLILVVASVSVALMFIGGWLIWRSIRRIRRIDHKIAEIKRKSAELRHLYYDADMADENVLLGTLPRLARESGPAQSAPQEVGTKSGK